MTIESLLRRAAFVGAFVLSAGIASPAHADFYSVTNTNDSGLGSLRDAVARATRTAANDTILIVGPDFQAPNTIRLTSGEIVVSGGGRLSIVGPSAGRLTLSGNNRSRIFNIEPNSNVTLSALNFTNGRSDGGGAIRIEKSVVTINDCVFNANTINSGSGGAIVSLDGLVTVNRSTFSNNVANAQIFPTGYSGGSGAAIANLRYQDSTSPALLTINNSTFVGNIAEKGLGGAVVNNNGQVVVNSSTFARNSAAGGNGGALHNVFGSLAVNSSTLSLNVADLGPAISTVDNSGAKLTLNNSILADNTTPSGNNYALSGTATASNYNLVDGGDSFVVVGNNNIFGVKPKLGPLANNGGPTQTFALLPGSPAINKGNTNFATDQRLVARPQRGADDIGAFEYVNTGPTLSSVTLSPAVPESNDTLTATVSASDPDGDALTYTYVWKKNGVVIAGEGGATLDLSKAGNGDDGDIITVTVQARDGIDGSNTLTSRPISVSNNAPSVVSLSPQGGNDTVGAKRTFTLSVRDEDGVGDVKDMWLLVNTRLNWSEGATLIYVPDAGAPTSGSLYLRQGDVFLPPMRIGEGAKAGAALDNGAVRIVGSEVVVGVGRDGKSLAIALPLFIRDGLVGRNQLFARVSDSFGATDPGTLEGDQGYKRFGYYTVVPQFKDSKNDAPTLSKLTPGATYTVLNSQGIAPDPQTFVFYAKDEDGLGDIDNVWFFAGQSRGFGASINFIFYPRTRRLFLRADSGKTLIGGGRIGDPGILENSYVRVDVSKVQMLIYPDGKSFGLRLPLQVKSALSRSNKVWLRVQDNQGATAPNGDYEGYVLGGTWDIVQGSSTNAVAAPSAGGS